MKLTLKAIRAKALTEANMLTNLEICANYLKSDGSDDLSHLTRRQINAYCGKVANAADVLIESGEDELAEIGEEILATAPSLWDYDTAGNYVGSVANENGITNS